jgi:hypothetical protein
MRPRTGDLVHLAALLPDGFGPLVERDAIPEEGVVVRHFFPTAAEDADLPGGSSCPSVRCAHQTEFIIEPRLGHAPLEQNRGGRVVG